MSTTAKRAARIAVILHTAFVAFIAFAFVDAYTSQNGHPQSYQVWIVPAFVDWLALAFLGIVSMLSDGRPEPGMHGSVTLITAWYTAAFVLLGGVQWYYLIGVIVNLICQPSKEESQRSSSRR